jgi:predicted nucleic acid-binding protein
VTILLDTNVISETTRQVPDPNVLRFLAGLDTAFVSIITVHELQFGICRLPVGQRRTDLATAIDNFLATFDDAVIDVDRVIARRAGQLRADAQARGRVLHLADALIAATALKRKLVLATRNASDFAGLGVIVVAPWGAG